MRLRKTWKPSPDEFGSTAAVKQLVRAIVRDNPDGVRLAIQGGADPNAVGSKGLTPLLFALPYKKNLRAIRALVEGGADPNASPPGLPHPMALAAKEPSGALLRLFLELGVAPNPLESKRTPYTATAIFARCFDNYRTLLEAGADINANVGLSDPLVRLLIDLGHWAVAADLLRRGADRTLVVDSDSIWEQLEEFAPAPTSSDRKAFDEVVSLLSPDPPSC